MRGRFNAIPFLLTAILACQGEPEVVSRLETQDSVRVAAPQKTEAPPAIPAPTLNLRMYPDMAVPGKEVVVEATVLEQSSDQHPALSFELTEDPCQGTFVVEGNRATYAVPNDCRGARLVVDAILQGGFPEVRKQAIFDIKKAGRLESVVLKHPFPGDKLTSPVLLRWDHTLYLNRSETLSVEASRKEAKILELTDIEPERIIEVDVPPSPEPLWMVASTSGGSVENLELRIWERRVPEVPPGALLLDDCKSKDKGSGGSPRIVLDKGGRVDLVEAVRLSPEGGEDHFLAMRYYAARKQSLRGGDTRLGFEVPVPGGGTTPPYQELEVWLRGDPHQGVARPICVQVKGSRGTVKEFKAGLIRDIWGVYHFPLYRALRKGNESIRSIAIYVRAEDVQPVNGLLMVGPMYLTGAPGTGGGVERGEPSGGELPAPGLEDEPQDDLL